MFCPYCGKEMADNDAYCGFCGAKNETVKFNSIPKYKDEKSNSDQVGGSYKASPSEDTSTSTNSNYENKNTQTNNQTSAKATAAAPVNAPKKKMSAGKIILTVFICCTIIVVLFMTLVFATFKTIFDVVPWDKADSYVEDFFDDFDDYYDDDSFYDSFEHSNDFTPGTTDVEKNSYKSEFGGLDFTLPSGFETYTKRDIIELYDQNGISSGEVENNITVYDFYSVNNISGTQISIDYYNKEYYIGEYDSVSDVIDEIKDSIEDYNEYDNSTVSFANDSVITINGEQYKQVAARISDDSVTYYEYDFVREVNGYFMKISIFAKDLDNVGELIDILNGETK